MSRHDDEGAGRAGSLLGEVRQRRAELRVSMGAFERSMASPAGSGGAACWARELQPALMKLYADFRAHVAITEGPDGLYCDLAERSPRLAHPVGRLTEEHGEITRRLEELVTWTDVNAESPDVAEVRRSGTAVLALLMRHRQRGSDLVFEAYEVDIGGET